MPIISSSFVMKSGNYFPMVNVSRGIEGAQEKYFCLYKWQGRVFNCVSCNV